MKNLHTVGKILAIIFSLVFAGLLYPTIVDTHGTLKSLLFTGLGVVVIWVAYFLLGSLFGHLYEEGRKDGEENNTDFV